MIEIKTYSTPVEDLTVIFTRDQVDKSDEGWNVLAAGFCPADDLLVRLQPSKSSTVNETSKGFAPLDRAISSYLDGDTTSVDSLPVQQPGTAFQQQVWSALREIPAGERRTYAQLAEMIARPTATRAVGTACGRNLVAPLVPCHRVVRGDGTLGGYYYGLDTKKWLLDHEEKK